MVKVTIKLMQAGEKGASVFMTGVIVAISSLVVAVVAPIIGYFVRTLIANTNRPSHTTS